jgi:hypothetical protein
MHDQKVQDIIQQALEMWCDEHATELFDVCTFDDVGVLTLNKGVVLRIGFAEDEEDCPIVHEYQISIVRSR